METVCLYILFSSIELNLEDTIKNKKRIIKSTTDNTNVEHTELVPNDSSKYNKNTNNIQQSTCTITRDKQQTSTVPKTKAICIPFIEQHIRTQDILESVKGIILASWRITTKNRYNTTYRNWQEFCSERNINSIQPNVNYVISLFSLLYHQGQGYRSSCNVRSALNNIIYIPEFSDISQHPLIKRFIKAFLI